MSSMLFPEMQEMKPPLKWAGGKRWLVEHLRPLWEKYQEHRLVEPFCGGLAVTLGLMPPRALLNDINPHLINFYHWAQKGFFISIHLANDEELYYQHRTRFNQLLKEGQGRSAEAASLFYYLNRTGFNGLCRFNRQDEFNVPFGEYKHINYIRDFSPYKDVLGKWVFWATDFAQLALAADDFIYADPPYDVEFTHYAAQPFTWDDQVRLAAWLSEHPGPVIVSNQATPRIVELYERLGFTLRTLDAPRRISCTGAREPAKEVIAVRNIHF